MKSGHALVGDRPRPSVEYSRLLRAIALVRAGAVERMGPRQGKVRGNEEPEYFVDVDGDPPCYCLDMQHSKGQVRQCKHLLAVRLVNYDPGVLQHFVTVIEQEERRKKNRQPNPE